LLLCKGFSCRQGLLELLAGLLLLLLLRPQRRALPPMCTTVRHDW
jgi:hypothetical protein